MQNFVSKIFLSLLAKIYVKSNLRNQVLYKSESYSINKILEETQRGQ